MNPPELDGQNIFHPFLQVVQVGKRILKEFIIPSEEYKSPISRQQNIPLVFYVLLVTFFLFTLSNEFYLFLASILDSLGLEMSTLY